MTTRSYHQYCALALSLDLIGDRWTLLILRELLLGPRRYSGIKRALPGIVSNLLAGRLQELIAAGLVQHRTLPPPAAVDVYELTAYGETTRDLIAAFTRWGTHLLFTSGNFAEDTMSPISAVLGLKELYVGDPAGERALRVQLHLEDGIYHMHFHQGVLDVGAGTIAEPDLILEAEPKQLAAFCVGRRTANEALAAGMLTLRQGSEPALEQFRHLFARPAMLSAVS